MGKTNQGGLALDVAGGQMYWTAPEEDIIYRAALDGSNVEVLLTAHLDAQTHPTTLSVPCAKVQVLVV